MNDKTIYEQALEAGFTEAQAKVLLKQKNVELKNLATKEQVENLRISVRRSTIDLKAEIEKTISHEAFIIAQLDLLIDRQKNQVEKQSSGFLTSKPLFGIGWFQYWIIMATLLLVLYQIWNIEEKLIVLGL